ncbi:hypothetical protein HPB49_002849 [Dermacentor silvarum]|uniref:Uncharacterized protein n=1 Tax=Dermacentor silvarum TaxID=543639 RepID=A0ACB8CJ39_DERSI|nr:hypothetical protein HPB49_002849 [Dermacentor silvarum]
MAVSVIRLLVQRIIMVLEWQPQEADINVIRNVRGSVKRSMCRRPLHRASVEELCVAEGNHLAHTDLAVHLFDSLPRRMAATVAVRGGMTKY